jgi:hypothetical protein
MSIIESITSNGAVVPPWMYISGLVLISVWWILLRPRYAGNGITNAPPMVLHSPVFPIPFIGVICEFFYGPNAMIQRCYEAYGPVFTIPVSKQG